MIRAEFQAGETCLSNVNEPRVFGHFFGGFGGDKEGGLPGTAIVGLGESIQL
jgi:hypothetical protein